jgi:hypothetical protein
MPRQATVGESQLTDFMEHSSAPFGILAAIQARGLDLLEP